MTQRRPLVPIREVLASLLERRGLGKRLEQVQVIEEWPDIVGPQIAAVTEPQSVTADGVLRVLVATAPWAAELSLMTPRILARINRERTGRIAGIRWIPGALNRESPSGSTV